MGQWIRNPEYKSHTFNCANFVSQCMYAGGVPENDKWRSDYEDYKVSNFAGDTERYWEETPAWINANKQYEYFSDEKNGYINGDVIVINKYDEISEAAKNKTDVIQPGDLLDFDFDGDGMIDHATMISKVENGQIYYTGNTVRRFNKLLKDSYEDGNVLYIVRINDEIQIEGACGE